METLIGLTIDGLRVINYDYKTELQRDIAFATIKDLPEEMIEAIKEATFEEVQRILSNYI